LFVSEKQSTKIEDVERNANRKFALLSLLSNPLPVPPPSPRGRV
jgi:hypothetical protein